MGHLLTSVLASLVAFPRGQHARCPTITKYQSARGPTAARKLWQGRLAHSRTLSRESVTMGCVRGGTQSVCESLKRDGAPPDVGAYKSCCAPTRAAREVPDHHKVPKRQRTHRRSEAMAGQDGAREE